MNDIQLPEMELPVPFNTLYDDFSNEEYAIFSAEQMQAHRDAYARAALAEWEQKGGK